jgi:hypothetical protein
MKKILLLTTLAIALVSPAFSQLKIDVNYPLAFGSNPLGENYKGWFDIGVRKSVLPSPVFKLQPALNVAMFRFNAEETSMLNLRPALMAELDLPIIDPRIGIAYTFSGFSGTQFSGVNFRHGLSYLIGINYSFIPLLYLNAEYEFLDYRAGAMVGIAQSNMFRIGLGLKI